MKAIANIYQHVEINEFQMGEALKNHLLKKHKKLFGLMSGRKQFFTVKNDGIEFLSWNLDWEKENSSDAILAHAANILLQK